MENIGFAEKYIAAFLKERLLKLSELKKKTIELCGGSCQQNYFCSFFFRFTSHIVSEKNNEYLVTVICKIIVDRLVAFFVCKKLALQHLKQSFDFI